MIRTIRSSIYPAAMALLPERMNTAEALAMALTIGQQESRFTYRAQIGGPARGFYQFEEAGVRGVLAHRASRDHAANACKALCYPDPGVPRVMAAIEHNDTLATIFARLLLWTHPKPLPARGDVDGAWRYYLDTWRPGKPKPATWPDFHARAWRLVDDPDAV